MEEGAFPRSLSRSRSLSSFPIQAAAFVVRPRVSPDRRVSRPPRRRRRVEPAIVVRGIVLYFLPYLVPASFGTWNLGGRIPSPSLLRLGASRVRPREAGIFSSANQGSATGIMSHAIFAGGVTFWQETGRPPRVEEQHRHFASS